MAQSNNASRFLFVKNVSAKVNGEDMYELFGRFGGIRQIRMGSEKETKGTAFVVYEELADARTAYQSLNGFHLQDRYLVVLYHQPKIQGAKDLARREAELEKQKKAHGID